ncbi:hypothetical protein [Nonomuraea dietziae]|uniref:hypothetical protein n=1 Tax=Nonomuraea dietziae TaxID=65515 RepID=UPI0031E32A8B
MRDRRRGSPQRARGSRATPAARTPGGATPGGAAFGGTAPEPAVSLAELAGLVESGGLLGRSGGALPQSAGGAVETSGLDTTSPTVWRPFAPRWCVPSATGRGSAGNPADGLEAIAESMLDRIRAGLPRRSRGSPTRPRRDWSDSSRRPRRRRPPDPTPRQPRVLRPWGAVAG